MAASALCDEIDRLLSLPASGAQHVTRMKSILSEKGAEAIHQLEGSLLIRHDACVEYVPLGDHAIVVDAADSGHVALKCARAMDASLRPLHVRLAKPGTLDDPTSGGPGMAS